MKVALLQCNSITGDIVGNGEKIMRAVKNARANDAGLCVTPELALCGVDPQNLLFSHQFVESCQKTLAQMAKALRGGPAVLIGSPMPTVYSQAITNAAVLIFNGTFSIISNRVFNTTSPYFESNSSFGIVTLSGWRIGVVLCDEESQSYSFWKMQQSSTQNPLMELISAGVDAIVHMASSPFSMNIQKKREQGLGQVAARHHIHVFSSNMVGGNDSTIYAGQSLAFGPTGALLARGYAFEEDCVMIDTAVENERYIMNAPTTEEEECWQALVLGTKDYVQKSGMEKVIIGLSGGIDSAVVAAIAVQALGKKNVLGVCLPSPHTSQESIDYAQTLAKNLDIELKTIAIAPLMQAFENALTPCFDTMPTHENDLTLENIQARIRGSLLMALANKSNALVLNTGNKSESAMGYCTLYGDAVGALGVIGDVSKTQLYNLANWYNEQFPRNTIPQEIIDRPPTAELRPNQKDSDSLPEYVALDESMEQLLLTQSSHAGHDFDDNNNDEHLQQSEVSKQVFAGLCHAEFKRRQCPPALHISQKALGKDWCIPMVNKVRLEKK